MLMTVLAEEEKEVERCGEAQGTVTAAESWSEQEGMGCPCSWLQSSDLLTLKGLFENAIYILEL